MWTERVSSRVAIVLTFSGDVEHKIRTHGDLQVAWGDSRVFSLPSAVPEIARRFGLIIKQTGYDKVPDYVRGLIGGSVFIKRCERRTGSYFHIG
jgi:hypothetical protein